MKTLMTVCLLAVSCASSFAQGEGALTAKARLLPEVGGGLRAVHRGPDGNLYVLVSPAPAVSVFDTKGKLVKKIPDYPQGTGPKLPELRSIHYGEDMDVDSHGSVCVVDRGANAVKVWGADGSAHMSTINSPVSVAALPDGEVAVTTLRDPHLVIVFDRTGHDVREFGDPDQISDREDLNRFLNIGTVTTDPQGHVYYSFTYMPEPTVRQFDRFGYAGQDVQYTAVDAFPEGQAVRREIKRQEKNGKPPLFKPVLTAAGADPVTGMVWMALHNTLLRFDKDGNRRATYQLYTPEGARLDATILLIEKDDLLIGSDPLGLYLFERPDKKLPE